MIVIIEGGDGNGKAEIIEMMKRNWNLPVANIPKSPLRKYIDENIEKIDRVELQMLFALDRHLQLPLIKKESESGKIVILNRFHYSGIAHGRSEGMDETLLNYINDIDLKVDKIFFFNREKKNDVCRHLAELFKGMDNVYTFT